MFTRGIPSLMSSALDSGNIPAPRPSDSLAERCAQEAMRAMQADSRFMPLSERLQDPARYAGIQKKRRAYLESFLWIDPNPAALERMLDLIIEICEESTWSASPAFDDPSHPDIDVQAAETGVLLAWTLRRHGARLCENSPRLRSLMTAEVRRRLIAPVLAHDDYPFMIGNGCCPALILSDILLSCLLMEKHPSRRQQPVKQLTRLLDGICAQQSNPCAPLEERLADACAVTDLARLLKRLTRGELDLTRTLPPPGWLDDIIICWIHGEAFINPSGESMKPEIAGMDLFRLGYLARYRGLCFLGAQMDRMNSRPAMSLSGRILSMEYMRAAQDECAAPVRLKRACAENGSLMLSRTGSLFAAITGAGTRANTGDIYIYADSTPILADAGGAVHSLPLIDGCVPVMHPRRLPPINADFNDGRDLMSVDLTEMYPQSAMIGAYQRTLMTMRSDDTVRLVDAFEFNQPPQQVTFRFVCTQRPLSLRENVRLGPATLTWDGNMIPEITELPSCPDFPGGCWLLSFTMLNVPRRLICGFTFERN